VDHDCVIGDAVHLAPGVRLAGDVQIGDSSLIGIGTVVIPGSRIGKGCTIGAGSVVIGDIPDYSVAYGAPAKVRRAIKTAT
jgi:acetyltransferase-like isoleucine patch superfamily enzyme